MVQTADGLGFTLEAFAALRIGREMFGQILEGNGAVQTAIRGTVNLAYTTRTDWVCDPVGTDLFTGS